MSIALRVLPSKLELERRDGSGILAPRANVSFTTFVYVSPVQTIPWCDQTGVPIHFHSSVISRSAFRINARMRAKVSPRHPPRSRIRWSISREAGFPVACSGLLARDVRLDCGFGFAGILGLSHWRVGARQSTDEIRVENVTSRWCVSAALRERATDRRARSENTSLANAREA